MNDLLEQNVDFAASVSGYIGMEMADALTRRGLAVTLVEQAASVLKTIDPEFGKFVSSELQHRVDYLDHKVYYPDAHEIRIRVTGDRKTGRLLGAQMLGHVHSEIAKRIDIFASALFHGMEVESLNNLDLSYTPPLSNPWDPVQMSAQTWVKSHERS